MPRWFMRVNIACQPPPLIRNADAFSSKINKMQSPQPGNHQDGGWGQKSKFNYAALLFDIREDISARSSGPAQTCIHNFPYDFRVSLSEFIAAEGALPPCGFLFSAPDSGDSGASGGGLGQKGIWNMKECFIL
ncbi:hypothetical protein CEXT_581591 [Caerostris extrusa]|uniref:Uncharacterized protein n=1 Tax=Caerostris extrusa TaxID=172846 RepID=A0AAV4XHN5_CAEEX|nr:hypothetical protein CEXT_581591 [Caerostris extrusa]